MPPNLGPGVEIASAGTWTMNTAVSVFWLQLQETVGSKSTPAAQLAKCFWANGSVGKNKGGDTTTRTEIETAGSGKDLVFP